MQKLFVGGFNGARAGLFWGAILGYVFVISIFLIGLVDEIIANGGVNGLPVGLADVPSFFLMPLIGSIVGIGFGLVYGLIFGALVLWLGWEKRAPHIGGCIGFTAGIVYESLGWFENPDLYTFPDATQIFGYILWISVAGLLAGWLTGRSYRKRIIA